MNQRFLTNFSLIVIKYAQYQQTYSMGNESFLRSEIFLSTNQTSSNFENYLFYAETDTLGNYEFKTMIEFEQQVLFRHKLSNKFLSYSVEYKDDENDSIVKLQLSDKPCYWKIIPCFQYQTKISPKVKFNEDVYLATELNSTKLGYVTVRQTEIKDHLKTNVSLNLKSKLVLHSYFELEKEEKGYIYGQAVWIKHVESNTFTTVIKPESTQQVMFESVDMQDNIQSINGLWLIESIKSENGGNLNYNQPFYLKSLCTQKYLAFEKEVRAVNNEKIYNVCLVDQPSLECKFYFESLKGEESKVRKGSYLIFKHLQSGVYLGTRHKAKTDSITHFSLLTFSEFEDEDLFDLIQLKNQQEEAIRFIFSIKKQLLYINKLFSNREFVITKRSLSEIEGLYLNILGELHKLTNTPLFEQVQDELGSVIVHFCQQINEIRLRTIKNKQISKLMKNVYEILRMVCRNYRDNQVIAYNFIKCFVEDIFTDSGAEELFSEIFRNNYSLLCKIANELKELHGRNLINTIFSKIITSFSSEKNLVYWTRITKLFDLLEVLIHYRDATIDINQRLISTQLFANELFSKIFFEIRVFNQRIRMLHPQSKKWVGVQQITDARFILILQKTFNLLSKLCQNRNFISKQYIDKYLNSANENGVQIIISYLNIPISLSLSNNLFSLITNCYIDSSPRINRNKPLAILNFTFSDETNNSNTSDAPDYNSTLKENLLNKTERMKKYLGQSWAISNILQGMATTEPGLNELQFDLYKEELNEKMKQNQWSQQLLRSMCILIKLESYTSAEIQEIQRMLCESILSQKINKDIIVSIMHIFQEINIYALELELKKITAFLKYKFSKESDRDFNAKDIKHYLSAKSSISSGRRLQRENGVVEIVAQTPSVSKYRKQYNHIITALNSLSPSKEIKKILLGMFAKNQSYPFSILSAIFKTILNFYSPKLRIVNLLTRSIILTQEEISNFEEIFIIYKKIKHLASIAEHWLSNSGNESIQSKQYCFILLQFTNYLYDDYVLNSEQDRRFRKTSKLNINRQLLVLNLSVHEVVLQLLNANFYLLQFKNKHEIPEKIRDVFEVSFEFLYFFCHNCQQNLESVASSLQTIERFRELAEVGQTKMLILLYKELHNLVKQVKPITIEKMISKIIRTPLNSSLERECEYNPEYLEFITTLCFDKEKVYKKNLEIIFKVIEKENILRKILFTQDTKNNHKLDLNPRSFKSNPLQVPILYHKNLIKLFALLFQYLEYSGSFIKNKIKQSINIDELLKMLALPDIYSHRGTIPEMNFLLKKEVLVLLNLYLDKTDSLIMLYESKDLNNLLMHFINIFVLNKERETIQCDKEILYLPFLEQHSQEIRYDLRNQRDFYTTQVIPLLNRLLSLFEKYSNKQSNKNYEQLLVLLENVKTNELPQDHLLKHEQNGIDLIRLKWRNFVDSDQENSVEEKFVKKTILQLLRDDQTYQLIQEEKEEFFKTIKETEEKYFEMMSKLIKMASEEENQSDKSEESRLFFYEMIRNLAEYLVWTTKQESLKKESEKKGWEGGQLAQTLIGYIIREQFEFNNAISRKTFYEIIRILVFLLENDEESKLLKQFYKIFTNTPPCFRFFNCLKDSLSQVSDRISGNKSHEQINEALSELYVCGEQRKCQLDKQVLKFLTLLCRYSPFTELLRSQPYNISTDFLDKIYNSFYFLVKRANQAGLTLNVSIVSISEDILDCVLAMLNGCNQANQNYIIDNKFPQIVVQALKMDAIQETRNRGELAKRDRLIEQVCGFYLSNGINVEQLINEKIKLIDFQHSYLLNRFKYTLLKLTLQTTIANERGLSKIRILLPPQLLKINLIWIYEDFKKEKIEYSEENILRIKQEWSSIIKKGDNLHGIFLMIGFYFFQLIQHNQISEKEGNDEQAESAASEQKEKQKIIKKFFSSISEKQKNEERVKDLQKQPFAEEMKLFYNKYYEAYDFFDKRTFTIQASIYENLIKLYFPKIPLCDKISEKMQEKLIQEAERISHEEKIKSLMAFEQQSYDFLQGEEDYFIDMTKRSAFLGRVAKLVKNEDKMHFFVWCMSVIIVLGYLLDDFESPSTNFSQEFANYLTPTSTIGIFILITSMINLFCGFLLMINMLFRKVPFLLRLYEYKYNVELEQEGKMADSLWLYQLKHIFSASFFDIYTIIFSIFTILHPLFAGFLLVYIVKMIELGKTIVRAIEETWFSLFVAAGLLIVFNYIFSILIYCATFTDDVGYGTTCKTLFTCLLMLVDQSLKAGSGFLATNQSDFTYMTLNFKVIAEIMYILFAQKVIFEIFSGTIIDKFGQLRQEGDSTEEDQSSNCFICGQERFEIDFELQGFEEHVGKTHNKLSYVYYLFYLRRKAKKEYGIEQIFIREAHQRGNNDWIPDGTSIEKQIKEQQNKEEKDEDDIAQYQKFYQKKLHQFKKLHQKAENISSQLKEQNLSI